MNTSTKYKPINFNGRLFASRLLKSKEWDQILDTLGPDNQLLHCTGHSFWCQDIDQYGWATVRGGTRARASDQYSKTDCGPVVGYRPCLIPLDPYTLQEAPEQLSYMKDGTVLTMGSLYNGGYVYQIPKNKDSEGKIDRHYVGWLRLGQSDPSPAKQIQWVKVGNLLVADRVLLDRVSYHDLDMFGLVFGKDDRVSAKYFETRKAYTKHDLVHHEYHHGLCTSKTEMLENTCLYALLKHQDYALYLEPQGTYAMAQVGGLGPAESRFGSNLVAVASPVQDYARKETCIYIQAGPLWNRDTRQPEKTASLIDLIDNAISQLDQHQQNPETKKVQKKNLCR